MQTPNSQKIQQKYGTWNQMKKKTIKYKNLKVVYKHIVKHIITLYGKYIVIV